eukprot:scpid81869/ scgid25173/ 
MMLLQVVLYWHSAASGISLCPEDLPTATSRSRMSGGGRASLRRVWHQDSWWGRKLGPQVGTKAFGRCYRLRGVCLCLSGGNKFKHGTYNQIERLANVAATHPDAAFAAFVFGLHHRCGTFLQRTMPTVGDNLQPLQDAICTRLLPALTKHEVGDLEMEMVALPARHGGLSFDNPVEDSPRKHAASLESTAHLSAQITPGGSELLESIWLDQATKSAVRIRHRTVLEATATAIQDHLPQPQQRAMSLAHEKGGSSTLTTVPMAEHGFSFDAKADYDDHIRLSYC